MSLYLWIKAFHVVMVTSWFAGLFYLPRIFVNLAMVDADPDASPRERDRLILMATKLYRFMGPLMALAVVLGLILWLGYGVGFGSLWMPVKFLVVVGLIAYHVWCGRLLKKFTAGPGERGHVWFRWFNEAPVIGLFIAVVLVIVKPF
ncbi:MAG: CopD family protein [Burkholderiaceae bacterium]